MADSVTSYIEDGEVDQVNKILEKNFGFPIPKVCGFNMLVKIYVREEDMYILKDKYGRPVNGESGKQIKIAISENIRASEKYKNCTALVIAQGPRCYTGEEYKDSGPSCKVGDFISFPRNEFAGTQIYYRGQPMQLIRDNCVLQVIKSPRDVIRHKMLS